jgi:hypothetical protein
VQIDPTNDGQASTFPLIIGVTGHRDIAPSARHVVADAVGTLLRNLKHRFGQDALYVLSALAQGADQLVAQLAVANGIKLITVLPMPVDDYRATMADDADALCQFEQLRKHAALELVLPWVTPPDQSRCDKLQYEQLGAVLSRYSHILLALWDGLQRWETLDASQRQEARGGTAHVVYLRANAEREAEGFGHSRLFADADSRLDIARGGPVLQVVTPRVKTGGRTANLANSRTNAGECIMLQVKASQSQPVTAEELSGRSPPCKDNLVALFGKSGAHELSQIEQLNACIRGFNEPDRRTYRAQAKALRPKCSADLTGTSHALIEIMRRLQASADTAAQVYQRRLLGTAMNWRALHLSSVGALLCFAVLGPLAVALFSGYAHLRHEWWLMILYRRAGSGKTGSRIIGRWLRRCGCRPPGRYPVCRGPYQVTICGCSATTWDGCNSPCVDQHYGRQPCHWV